ncbi:cytochrome-c peroxidase [Mariniblastus sp.]|nr:cytochrome-c peroxidase [Mariniblastus sp.]
MKLHLSNFGLQQPLLSRCLLLVAVVLSAACVCGWALPTEKSYDNDDDKPLGKVPKLPIDSLPTDINATKIPGGFNGIPEDPADNATTAEKVKLGRKLFFDPILSTDGTVSCASCHQPDHGFASPDPIAVGIGGKMGKRNAPSVINRVFGKKFSWDGRDDTLEQQVLGPLKSETELGGNVELVIENLKKKPEYVEQFHAVFGRDAKSPTPQTVTVENLAKAIASFERTLTSGNSKVDRFRAAEYEALSKEARQGLWIFESRGGCWKCHSGSNLSDEAFHNTGVGFGKSNRDQGRFEATKKSEHEFQYKTPTLRDIEFTAPYMHDGSVKTLKEVVEFYNRGGAPDDPSLDNKMAPLNLSEQEIGFLVEFLKALSGESVLNPSN